ADVRRRIGLESPGHRQHAHVFAVDLRERAKAFAGVVAVVGGPTVFCGIQDRRGIEPLPACAENGSGSAHALKTRMSVRFLISMSPGKRTGHGYLYPCTWSAVPHAPPADHGYPL